MRLYCDSFPNKPSRGLVNPTGSEYSWLQLSKSKLYHVSWTSNQETEAIPILSFIGVVNQPPSSSAGISGRSNNDYGASIRHNLILDNLREDA